MSSYYNPFEDKNRVYDINRNTQGFNLQKGDRKIHKLSATHTIPEYELYMLNNDDFQTTLKHSLIHEIVSNIIDEKLYKLDRVVTNNVMGKEYLYRMTLNILEQKEEHPNISVVSDERLVFKINDVEFNNEELVKAVRKTYPERLI